MNIKKIIAALLSTTMVASSVAAFAAAPSSYDGQAYESVGYTSEDPDGEINLAVIAKGKVDIVGDEMYIKGSVYSNDTIYVGNGGGNRVDGLFISGVKGMWDYANPLDGATDDVYRYGYIHVDDNHDMTTNAYSVTLDYEGSILDTETSYEAEYEPYTVPEIENFVDTFDANQYWPGVQTVSESTHFGTLSITGQGLIVDTSAGDVTLVIDNFNPGNAPEILTTGGNKVNIYIKNSTIFNNFNVAIHDKDTDIYQLEGIYGGGYSYKNPPSWMPDGNPVEKFFAGLGDSDKVNLYLGESGQDIVINGSKWAANVYSNADSLKVAGSAKIKGNVTSAASSFVIDGEGTYIEGNVTVPNAESVVSGAATIMGQLYTDTLTNNGAGQIVYKADKGVTKTDTPTPTVEPTPVPTTEPTPEPSKEPVPTGTPIDLTGTGYAYIFGYEPDHIELVWNEEEGHSEWNVQIRMAPNDSVTREQVASMIMRMIDQKYDNKNVDYPVTSNISKLSDAWYTRGLAYEASVGAFDDVDEVTLGPVTRGEVAKLVVFGLGLTETTETSFADIENSPFKSYIEIMNAYGYMQGVDANIFEPDRVMTRAEFCSMFNQIIGRSDASLTAADGTQVTPATYYFTDLKDTDWYTPVMLRATSAYDENGYVDIETRLANIRNKLDHYDSQKMF